MHAAETPSPARGTPRLMLLILLLCAWMTPVVWQAWASDDAFITLRVVDNALHGYGLRWNVAERVQVYTHPLWMFLALGATSLAGSAYHAIIWLSWICSAAAVGLVFWRVAGSLAGAVLAALLLVCSTAFLDYSTSGLENPLTHLLLALFVLAWVRQEFSARGILVLSLLASLIMLNRIDAGLLVLPALGVALWRRREWRQIAAAALGMLPLAAWEAFSIVYYGFPFPNTAYAKMGTGVDQSDLLVQGIWYYVDSLRWDTLTLVTVAAGLLAGVTRDARLFWPLTAGIVLYLAYILKIGGDFMAGRFFAAPFFLAVLTLCRMPLPGRRTQLALIAAIVAARLALAGLDPEIERAHGITDQRRLFSTGTALFTQKEYPLEERWGALRGRILRDSGRRVAVHGSVGMTGFFAGPGVHIIDDFALTDALLARPPAMAGSRIGHFRRRLPAGYEESVRQGENRLESRTLRPLYDDLLLITRGPIWSPERWRAIVRLNVAGGPA